MNRKPSTWLTLIFMAILVLGVISPTEAYAASPRLLKEAIIKLLGGAKKSAPKHADELPPLRVKPKSTEEDFVLDGPLITRALARASHNKTCPSMKIRVSLPQLNIYMTVPEKLNIRSGSSVNYTRQAAFNAAGTYILDPLSTHGCWVQIVRRQRPWDRLRCFLYGRISGSS